MISMVKTMEWRRSDIVPYVEELFVDGERVGAVMSYPDGTAAAWLERGAVAHPSPSLSAAKASVEKVA